MWLSREIWANAAGMIGILSSFLLAFASPPPPVLAAPDLDDIPFKDAIAEHAGKLPLQIEDDLSDEPDRMLAAVKSEDCVTTLTGKETEARWTVDWTKVTQLGPGDTFIFVEGDGVKLALVGDLSKPGALDHMIDLYGAMKDRWEFCGSIAPLLESQTPEKE